MAVFRTAFDTLIGRKIDLKREAGLKRADSEAKVLRIHVRFDEDVKYQLA